jgi:hypothetical protein
MFRRVEKFNYLRQPLFHKYNVGGCRFSRLGLFYQRSFIKFNLTQSSLAFANTFVGSSFFLSG